VEAAVARREALYPGESCARLLYGEVDGLPGVVADRYGDALVLQVSTAGAEALRDRVEAALKTSTGSRLLVRKDDSALRELEGLPKRVECVPSGADPVQRVTYQGLALEVPLSEGQKTGLFLDQRENVRAFLSHLAPGSRVLDVFCYQGIWGLAALKAGAAEAEFVDDSRSACERVESALALNGLPDCEIHHGDAFDVLPRLRRAGKSFDAVVCDPPAFAKSRKHLPEAEKAYRRLNELAVSLVKPGGLLVTCSCSYHLLREAFREIVAAAVARSRREGILLESRGQAPDHPVLLSFPEGEYLKCLFVRVV
jgi:23S rRNA (cytosine1962-C5)-methyltransferase